jgi:hypothetical protein
MNEVSQLASAMLATAFAAVMLVVGQLYIENKSARLTAVPAALTASPWDPRSTHCRSRSVAASEKLMHSISTGSDPAIQKSPNRPSSTMCQSFRMLSPRKSMS